MGEWDDFEIVTADVADADRNGWTRLPNNGWGALVASVAGPEHVRGVRRPPGLTKVVTRDRDGGERRFTRPASPEELDMIQEGIVDYLSQSDTPPPPRGVEWEIRLPGRMNERDLDRGVNGAMMQAPDLDLRAQKAAVLRYMEGLFPG